MVVLGSVQEERGGLGAETGTFSLKPDAALVVDVTFGDSPDTPKEHGMPLGSGAAIGYARAGPGLYENPPGSGPEV